MWKGILMQEAQKTYRPWDPSGNASQTYSPDTVLPENDLVFFLMELVPKLDLSAFYVYYERETRGAPPYDVAMMCTLLCYAYAVGVCSSRKIAAACERNLAFMAIVGNAPPNFRTISDFRKIHLKAFEDLFIEVLRVAGELGMVRLGNLAIDGTKMKANASRHKAMSYDYMTKEVERLRAEIKALLARAATVDGAEDAALGSRRGDELPEELQRRQQRLDNIEAAMKRLEEEARQRAEGERQERAQAAAEREAQGKKRRGPEPKPIDETPKDRAQTNFTDPESKIMKTNNKGFDYCYNAQAVVDGAHQIIVAVDTTNACNDKQQAVPMAEAALENLQTAGILQPPPDEANEVQRCAVRKGTRKICATLDSGYFSEEAVKALEAMDIDPHMATGRQKHHEPQPAAAQGAPPAGATAKERMAHKLRTAQGKKCYAQRKQIVEPVFGQTKHARGIRQFLLRGLKKVRGEWNLIALTHNLLKIWRYQCALR
jgi:transposase